MHIEDKMIILHCFLIISVLINNGSCDDIDFAQFKREVLAHIQNLTAKYEEDIQSLKDENRNLKLKVNLLSDKSDQSSSTVQTLRDELKVLTNDFNETKVEVNEDKRITQIGLRDLKTRFSELTALKLWTSGL